MITNIAISNLLKKDELGRLSEPGGLELRKLKKSVKWYGRFRKDGELIQVCLGNYPDVTIAGARAKLAQVKQAKQEGPADVSVRRAFELWIAKKSQEVESWQPIEKRVKRHIVSKLGGVAMSDLTAPMLIKAWEPLEKAKKYETIKRLCRYVRETASFMVNTGRVENIHSLGSIFDNYPASKVRHRPTIPPAALTDFFYEFYEKKVSYGLAYDLLRASFYTLLRQQEVTRMKWDWIKDGIIEVPAEIMKMRRPHRVPVTTQMERLLAEIPQLNEYVFASPYRLNQGLPAHKETLNKSLIKLGFKDILCAHGIRAIGSTYLAQQGVERSVREACLAHLTGTSTELAYQNYDYINERKSVMQDWCDFVEECSKKAQQKLKNNPA